MSKPPAALDVLSPREMKKYGSLISDVTPWAMVNIARELGVQPQTVRSWRRESMDAARGGNPHPNLLPDPDWFVPGKPMWKAGTIRRWAMQTGRMSPQGLPLRLKPPGRPRGAAVRVA